MMVTLLLRLSLPQTMPRQMRIAAIFEAGGEPKHELAFRHAVQSINRNRLDMPRNRIGKIRNAPTKRTRRICKK